MLSNEKTQRLKEEEEGEEEEEEEKERQGVVFESPEG